MHITPAANSLLSLRGKENQHASNNTRQYMKENLYKEKRERKRGTEKKKRRKTESIKEIEIH